MKKYKLIREYPGSPELGTVVEKSKDNVHYVEKKENFLVSYPFITVENSPEFWEEIVERDYEIMSFYFYGEIYKNTGKTRLYFLKSKIETIFQASSNRSGYLTDYNITSKKFNEDYYIHSVKRLSDGEVFIVGDKAITKYKNYGDITAFELKYNSVYITTESGKNSCNLEDLKPVKKPIFITEDGIGIFEGDTYYAYQTGKEICYDGKNYYPGEIQKVTINGFPNSISDKHNGKSIVNLKEPTIKRFSTKEAAEKHVLMNKKSLSVNDVLDVVKDICPSYDEIELKLIKSIKA